MSKRRERKIVGRCTTIKSCDTCGYIHVVGNHRWRAIFGNGPESCPRCGSGYWYWKRGVRKIYDSWLNWLFDAAVWSKCDDDTHWHT